MQVRSWREQGFVLVDGLIPIDLISELLDAAVSRFPAADSNEAADLNDFGGGMTFPDQKPIVQLVVVAPSSSQLDISSSWCPLANSG